MSKKNNRKYRIGLLTALGATLAAFFISAIWYMAFGSILATISDVYANDQNDYFLWTMLVEFGRSFVIALSLYYLIRKFNIDNWQNAVKLGAFLWIFPFFILVGSIVHEHYPIALALIHAGDWLVKLLVISVILGWRQQKISNN